MAFTCVRFSPVSRQYQDELTRRFGSDSAFSRSGGSHGQDSLTAALRERLQLDEKSPSGASDLAKLPTHQVVRRLQKLYEELTSMVNAVTVNADRLLGQDVDYSGQAAGEGGYS